MSRAHIRITSAKQCHQDWSMMSGSLGSRHCESCNQTVHDVAQLTLGQLEHLTHANQGGFCARIARDQFGRIITAPSPAGTGSTAVNLALFTILGTTLGAGAQVSPKDATVGGKVLLAQVKLPAVRAEVVFVQNGMQVAATQTDAQGTWETTLPAGTYDVIFRTGALFGERVNSVTMHPGQQSFAPVTARFAYGHLQPEDARQYQDVFVGQLISVISGMSFHYAIRHPMAYLAMISRRVVHSLS